jgi:hypothetical protein
MTQKQEALLDIVALARHHNISLAEINQALSSETPTKAQANSVLSKLLGYIGGIFVFAGIGIFIAMYWDDFNSAQRVIVTLGTGLIAFFMGVACLTNLRYERAATPLFLMSFILQPMGILVMLQEYASGGDVRHGILFMAAYMLIQQGATFWAKGRTVLAFGAIFFGCIFFANLFDIMHIDEDLIGTVMGVSLLCIAYALNQSRHAAIAPFWYLVGGVILMCAVFDAVKNTPFELLYLGLSALLVFMSTYVRSRTLLLVGTLSMLIYIGYFTAKHFANTVGWPIALVMTGIALIALSAFAIKLNNKYIKSSN